MGDLIVIDAILNRKMREDCERMAANLRNLALRAEEGELKAVVFVAIPVDAEYLSIGALKTGGVGIHELVGATTVLNDFIRKTALES